MRRLTGSEPMSRLAGTASSLEISEGFARDLAQFEGEMSTGISGVEVCTHSPSCEAPAVDGISFPDFDASSDCRYSF